MRRRGGWAAVLGAVTLFSGWGAALARGPEPVRIAGVTWEPTVRRAQARAAREDKPVLIMHLFGRLDEEFC